MRTKTKNILILEENGAFPNHYPIPQSMLTHPGLEHQPDFCCSISSGRSHVIDIDLSKPGAPVGGHHNCNLAPCPECSKHWLYSETFYALTSLEAVCAAHPGSSVHQLKYGLREQDNVSCNYIKGSLKSLKRILNEAPYIHGAVAILHNDMIKPDVEAALKEQYLKDFGFSPTRTELYRKAFDLAYLWHCGFKFKDWREAFDTYWHWHVYVVVDHYPAELYIHGNQKRPLSKFLVGGPVLDKSYKNTENNCLPTTRPDGTPCNWTHNVKVKDHTCPYEGADLARSLYYCYTHVTLSSFKSLEFKALHLIKECYNLKLDFIHDKPTETIIEDPITEEITSTVIYPDPRVTASYESLKSAFHSIHRRGKWVYPGEEKLPPNEDLPRTKPYNPPLLRISARIFQLPTIYKDGQRIPADGAEFVYRRRDDFIQMLWAAEEEGLIPIPHHSLSNSWKGAFVEWDKRCFDLRLGAKERLLYSTDFKGYEDLKKANWTVDLGFISKAAAYKFPDSYEFLKFRALRNAFYKALWRDSGDFSEVLTQAMEEELKKLCSPEVPDIPEVEPVNPQTKLDLGAYPTCDPTEKPQRKHIHLNLRSKKKVKHSKAQEFWNNYYREKRLQESLVDGDFDSVDKLSWIVEMEDPSYEEDC